MFYFHCINYIQKHVVNQIAIIFYAVGFGISTCSDLDDLKYMWHLWKKQQMQRISLLFSVVIYKNWGSSRAELIYTALTPREKLYMYLKF